MASSASAEARDEFPAFPFEPYPVQLRFMKEIYGSLQRGGVAVAESPTGICNYAPFFLYEAAPFFSRAFLT